MLNLAGFQDAFNAILVIIIVSIVIAVAWLSTNVREQPLIATAVVVFQSGVNGEGDRSASVTDSAPLSNRSGGTQEGEGQSVRATSTVKENESTVMEVTPKPKTEELPTDYGCEEVTSVEPNPSEKDSDNVLEEKESVIDAEATGLDKGAMAVSSSHESVRLEGSNHDRDSSELHSPSFKSSSSSEKPQDEASQEMEVRNRRLKHFVTMGGSHMTETHHEACVPPPEDSKETSSLEKDDGGMCKDSSSREREASPSVPAEDCEERPPGSIRIRLKFLDESQKYVFAQPTEQVGRFKRQHFSIEMDANRRIRLIFNGQLLSQDSSTLGQYGLFDNCVVHCHVSQPQQVAQNSNHGHEVSAQEDEDAYVTSLLAPLLYFVMVVMWYLRYEYSHLFNTMSTIILLFLTALLLISTYLLYITQNVPGSDSAAQISSHHQIETNSLL